MFINFSDVSGAQSSSTSPSASSSSTNQPPPNSLITPFLLLERSDQEKTLARVIERILAPTKLSYYQGFHDIVSVALSLFSPVVSERFQRMFGTDCTGRSMVTAVTTSSPQQDRGLAPHNDQATLGKQQLKSRRHRRRRRRRDSAAASAVISISRISSTIAESHSLSSASSLSNEQILEEGQNGELVMNGRTEKKDRRRRRRRSTRRQRKNDAEMSEEQEQKRAINPRLQSSLYPNGVVKKDSKKDHSNREEKPTSQTSSSTSKPQRRGTRQTDPPPPPQEKKALALQCVVRDGEVKESTMIRMLRLLSFRQLRNFLSEDIQEVAAVLDKVFVLVNVVDKELGAFLLPLQEELPISCFLIGWFQTWFSHDFERLATILTFFDFFLVTHTIMPVYVAAALLIFHRRILFDEDLEHRTDCVYHQIQQLPGIGLQPHEQEFVLLIARRVFSQMPPSQLLSSANAPYDAQSMWWSPNVLGPERSSLDLPSDSQTSTYFPEFAFIFPQKRQRKKKPPAKKTPRAGKQRQRHQNKPTNK